MWTEPQGTWENDCLQRRWNPQRSSAACSRFLVEVPQLAEGSRGERRPSQRAAGLHWNRMQVLGFISYLIITRLVLHTNFSECRVSSKTGLSHVMTVGDYIGYLNWCGNIHLNCRWNHSLAGILDCPSRERSWTISKYTLSSSDSSFNHLPWQDVLDTG